MAAQRHQGPVTSGSETILILAKIRMLNGNTFITFNFRKHCFCVHTFNHFSSLSVLLLCRCFLFAPFLIHIFCLSDEAAEPESGQQH